MKVKDAIKYLKKLKPNDDIVIAWWEHEAFPDVSNDDWPFAAERADDMDWSNAHSDIESSIYYALLETIEDAGAYHQPASHKKGDK